MHKGIFGGTFDPPHNGHINLAKRILQDSNIEEIIFIPAASPPHKPNVPITKFEYRYEMVKLAIEGIENFAVSDIENRRKKSPSYTIDTIRELKKKSPNDIFTVIIGEDSLKQLHTWYKSKELVKECEFLSYPRPGENTTICYLEKFWERETALKLLDSLLNFEMNNISSTEIRNGIYGRNAKAIKELIPEEVYEYIQKNSLYLRK